MLRCLLLLLITLTSCSLAPVKAIVPISTAGPTTITESRDALLTCVVAENAGKNTVIWKRGSDVLTAGAIRVTNDPRIRIIHDENPGKEYDNSTGEVWVLQIEGVRLNDSGRYTCELNSNPVLSSIHVLSVRPSRTTTAGTGDDFLVPPPIGGQDNVSFWQPDNGQVSHDFTECCERANVTARCMGFCNVHNILDGTTGTEPEVCEKDFPSIVRCMADGRNHVPCCVEKQIPDLCQDMCRGDYTPFTDQLKTRVSCVQHTLNGLQCILQGVQLIPSNPLAVSVDELSETHVALSWLPPEKLGDKVARYNVNLTILHSFDEDDDSADEEAASEESDIVPRPKEKTTLHEVAGNRTTLTIYDLVPLTMYTITVTAANEHGASLPSDRVRIFTHTSAAIEEQRAGSTSKSKPPSLPDVLGCCESNGMSHRTCLNRFCDPQQIDSAKLPEFMVCAPWSNITFHCLANQIDHTPCCRARGIPEACFPLCSGNVTSLDFALFKCLRYMSDYSSCLFQGYGVIAGPPTKLHVVAKTSNFIILDWNKPKLLPETVTSYHIKFRRLGYADDYLSVEKKSPPFILESLQSNVYYEFYVVSVNAYGKSEASPRLITRTPIAEPVEPLAPKYNMTACCRASGLLPQCAPLCSYDIRLSDIDRLGPACRAQMSVIARCAAGGRNHSPCCNRRGVIPACMPLCRGVMPSALLGKSPATTAAAGPAANTLDCLSYAGNILQCFEEGTDNIPGPPEDVHVTSVANDSISLSWSPPDSHNSSSKKLDAFDNSSTTDRTEDSDSVGIDYVVQYGKVNNMTVYETVAKLENELTTKETSIELNNLEPNAVYRILVLTRGKYGTSLPSSMLLINTTTTTTTLKTEQGKIYGAPSPPHSLSVIAQSATWLQIVWQPPEYSHPHEKLSYRVYHKPPKADKFIKINTTVAWLRMIDLKPSSQHVVYVEAIGKNGVSMPSEVLVAWTDPALPAFVDPPTIHPLDNIPEGGSMTILCLALGNPAPTISLYVGGHLVRQDTSRHMVTVIHNVSTDMEQVSCYADNGYGVPMQATRRINISYPPKIQAAGITVAAIGDDIELRCTIDSRPTPKVSFWRDHDGRMPIINGARYNIGLLSNTTRPSVYMMTLRINKLQANDSGDYFCHASNVLGSATIPVSVRIRNTPALAHNVTECCARQNVSLACRSACSYYVDFDAVADKPECVPDFDKLMKCAADGSDHRACCADENVPRKCLNWCRGEQVRAKEICSLQFSRTIIGCFEKNRDRLPGPPANIVYNVISETEVQVKWDPPMKNPNAVDGYRIFYHEAVDTPEQGATTTAPTDAMHNATSLFGGSNPLEIRRIDVKDTSINIEGLKKDALYELVVKAGNVYGASVLSEPVRFVLNENQVTTANNSEYSGTIGTISGIFASIFVLLVVAILVILYRRQHRSNKSLDGVAFENPTYARGLEQVQLPTVTQNGFGSSSSSGGSGSSRSTMDIAAAPVSSTRASGAAKLATRLMNGTARLRDNSDTTYLVNEATGTPMPSAEVNPSIYEELKLGQEGAGFKKLVP